MTDGTGSQETADTPGTAVVTGASSGIGHAYAEALAARGHALVLVARRAQRLAALGARLREEHGVRAEELAADLTEPDHLEKAAARVAGRDVALLVNSAGINGYGPFVEADPELIGRVVALNVTALTRLTRAALPAMFNRGGGAVVNVSSLLAFSASMPTVPRQRGDDKGEDRPTRPARHGRAVYGGTKAYAVAFSRLLAGELAGTPVAVQLLLPGLTDTEFHLTDGSAPVEGDAPRRDGLGGMAARDVVTASLSALGTGRLVCAPGLPEPEEELMDRLATAESYLRQKPGAPLAERYR